MKFDITCTDFRKFRRNTLCGFATIKLPDLQLTIRDVAIHQKNSSHWAALPAKPMIDTAGVARRNDAGKIEYVTIFEFDSAGTRNAFSQAVVTAVLDFDAAALTE
jgi:hypothetical protein